MEKNTLSLLALLALFITGTSQLYGAKEEQHARNPQLTLERSHSDKNSHTCCGKLKKTNCKVKKQCISIPARGSVPAAEIYVKIQGNRNSDKPVILFFPGTCETSDTWACQQEEFCKEFITISLDPRGTGRSTHTSPSRVKYTYELYADDLHAVLKKLGIKKFIYVGHSIGANIGIVYFNRFPGQITKLVLVAGDPFIVVPDCAVLSTCSVPTTCSACWPFPLATVSGIKALEAQIPKIGFDQFAAMLSKNLFYNESCQSKLVKAQALETEQLIRSGPQIFRSIVRNAWREDIRALVPKITIPTLICVGSLDAVLPPGASLFMHDNIPSSILREFVGKGHNLMISDYKQFNKALVEFITCKCCQRSDSVKVFGPCCVCPLAKPVHFKSCRSKSSSD